MFVKKKQSLSLYITIVVVILLSLLGSAIYFGVFNNIETVMLNSQEQSFNRQMQLIEHTVLDYIEVRRIILQDFAEYPIVVQSVMQTADYQGNLKDFMSDLEIIDEQYQTTLLDFKGQVIFDTVGDFTEETDNSQWFSDIIDEKIPYYTHISTSGENWIIAVPVIYNQIPEGVLMIQMPINGIFDNQNIIPVENSGMELSIFSQDKMILQYGEKITGWEEELYIEDLDIQLVGIFDRSRLADEMKTMSSNIILTIAVFTFIVMVVLVLVSKRFIGKPLRNLEDLMKRLSDSENEKIDYQEQRIYELDLAFSKFKEMAETIIERENELEEASVVLVQQEKLASIGQLAAGVAHELNTPIGFLKSNFDTLKENAPVLIDYIEYLRRNKKEGVEESFPLEMAHIDFILEDLPEMLKESEEGYKRITTIVENLRDFSREDNKERSEYDLNHGIETTLIVSRNEYKYIADIDLNLRSIPPVFAVGGEINEVILNIIVNATQALRAMDGKEKTTIHIDTYEKDGYVCCDVRDEGPGIPEEIRTKIFDPFFTTKAREREQD